MPPKFHLPIPSPTFVSERGYSFDKENNSEQVEYFKEFCTVTPRINPNAPGANFVKSFAVYRENSKKIYIPRGLGLSLLGEPTVSRIPDGEARNMVFNGKLRSEQEPVISAFIKSPSGGIISLPCGHGKTTIALYLASLIKRKTLVVCHKEFLITQWRERIAQFLPNTSIGLIKAQAFDTDKDIVIASLQSLAMKEYPSEVFRTFGFVVIDEVHHTSAQVFSQALPKITAKVMLGLSATLDRKDGLRKVFEWYLGKPVYIAKKQQASDMIVRMVEYHNPGQEILMRNGKLNIAAMINAVCLDRSRNQLIINELFTLLKNEPERKVLILSDRRNHLQVLETMIQETTSRLKLTLTTGLYIGGMKEDALAKSAQCSVILGTNMFIAEGVDIPTLNTLILASPISSVEQQIGRIQRQQATERTYIPYTIDIWDDLSIFNLQGNKRHTFYNKKGYKIQLSTQNSIQNSTLKPIDTTSGPLFQDE